jgi:hypothetical protein
VTDPLAKVTLEQETLLHVIFRRTGRTRLPGVAVLSVRRGDVEPGASQCPRATVAASNGWRGLACAPDRLRAADLT